MRKTFHQSERVRRRESAREWIMLLVEEPMPKLLEVQKEFLSV